jgi:hypothetical protein
MLTLRSRVWTARRLWMRRGPGTALLRRISGKDRYLPQVAEEPGSACGSVAPEPPVDALPGE